MFGGFGVTELLVILAIVVVLFGTTRLKSIGNDLGSAIRGFRKAMDEEQPSNGKPGIADRSEPTLQADEVTEKDRVG